MAFRQVCVSLCLVEIERLENNESTFFFVFAFICKLCTHICVCVFTHALSPLVCVNLCVCVFLRVQAMEGGSLSARKNPEWQLQTVSPSLSEWLCGGHLEHPASDDLAL